MKNKQILSFSQLEEEMEALKEQDAQSCVGGGWFDYIHDLDMFTVYGGGGGGGFMPSDFQPGGGNEDDNNYGGGGYTPEETPPEPGPPLKLKNLPGMCPQVGSTGECGMLAFEFLSKFYGGDKKGINKSDFAESIGIDTKEKAIRQFYFDPNRREPLGITDVEMYRICDTFFKNNLLEYGNLEQIKNSLSKEHPILMNYSSEGSNDGHAVVIVGYDPSTNQITLADPLATGGMRNVNYDPTMFKNLVEIEGMQDDKKTRKYRNNEDWWKGCGIGN